MKPIIVIRFLFVLSFLVSCNTEDCDSDVKVGRIESYDVPVTIDLKYKNYYGDWDEDGNRYYSYLTRSMALALEYRWDEDGHDGIDGEDWKLPERTMKDKGGDCDDLSSTFLYLVHKEYDVPFDRLTIVAVPNHIIARVDNVYYDPTQGGVEATPSKDIRYEMPFAEYLWLAKHYQGPAGKYCGK